MSRLKIVFIVVIAVLTAIIILQNTETTATRMLFATITMSKAILMLLVLAAGFILGMVIPGLLSVKINKGS